MRVLDLTDERGHVAGAVLAGLGAEVVAVEPPGGSASRRRAPMAATDPTVSLLWWAYNRSKRSLALKAADPFADDGFERLVRNADVVIDVGPDGATSCSAGAERLARWNPALVHVTVSPFGLDGPKAHWPAADLTVLAAGCQLSLTGDADRAPVRTAVPQAWLHAGAEAAVGALLALAERRTSGLGQRVDVSAQTAAMMAAVPAGIFGANGAADVQRMGGGVRVGARNLRLVYPAADGHVSIMHNFSSTSWRYSAELMRFCYEQGHCGIDLRDEDWRNYAELLITGQRSDEEFDRAKAAVASLTASFTKAELFAEAQRRGLLLAPVADLAEVLDSEQLAARRYWDEVDDPRLGRVRAPGAFARVSPTPLPVLGPAPALDADGPALRAEPVRTVPAPVPAGIGHGAGGSDGAGRRPLEGCRILDLSWIYAGPLTTRLLGDFGATVVKVESTVRSDSTRGSGPYLNGDLGPDGSAQFSHFNAGKLGLTLDLGCEAGRVVLRRLVGWADVVFDSFTPGVMAQWGFDAGSLLAINPQVIAVSTSLMGGDGPLASFSGFGNLAGAVTGFYELTGWADRAPAGPFLAYTDYIAPRYLAAVMLAALDQRARTGRGLAVDLAQQECALHFLAPALLERTVNGTVLSRMGNADRYVAPHGVYPTQGEDAWIAIVCETDEQWRALCALAGRSVPAGPARLDTTGAPRWAAWAGLDVAGRLALGGALDEAIGVWTVAVPGDALMAELVAAGVPAHVVQNSTACAADPQLRHRGHFRTVEHPVHGTVVVEGPRALLSRTPGTVTRGGPMLGEHAYEVLTEFAGFSADEVADLVADGALG
ncbi:MAG: CoA transferase [Acidimicrobiia bacterium]